MNQNLELPEAVLTALQKAAQANGMTPVDWIVANLWKEATPPSNGESSHGPGTLADKFDGRFGRIHGGAKANLSESCAEKFTDYLEAKKRSGNL